MVDMFIEIFIGLLLAATCAYCFILSRKLHALRKGQAELLSAIAKFDDASRRAEENLAAIQNNGLSMNRDLDRVMARANTLVDELSVMVHAGDNIAGRIEGAMSEVRAIGARKQAQHRSVLS